MTPHSSVTQSVPLNARSYLSLGSNMGDRGRHLRQALAGLDGVAKVSMVYETEPVGGPPGQGPYFNLAVELETRQSARQLLQRAQVLESQAGRIREVRWGPRPLDVDVLLVGDQVIEEQDLVVPHPRMWERAFVLIPLSDLVSLDDLPTAVLPPDWTEIWPQRLAKARLAGEVRLVGRLEQA
ncbi:MAG: 2-amino-4-hydroxy-6-hydroxymethyldihydropteridine diphosphokinase [Actinobacteria bacterium]|nr:2-amino-4-hydroxy-6-hydroxymethyldihydropteridine diphosphokinase [Actinomycetota bacterium]